MFLSEQWPTSKRFIVKKPRLLVCTFCFSMQATCSAHLIFLYYSIWKILTRVRQPTVTKN